MFQQSPKNAKTRTSPARLLTLSAAVSHALTNNPRVTATLRDIGISLGRERQAAALPNPELVGELDNAFGSGEYRGLKSAETTLQISQLIELGGKRDARVNAATAGTELARWEGEALRLEIASETTVAFVNVLSGQQRIRLLDEQIENLGRLTPLLQARVNAGASPPSDVLRGETALNIIKADRIRARTALLTARRELAAWMGMVEPNFPTLAGNLGVLGKPANFASIAAALDRNPQLTRWTALRAQRDAELLSARLKATPDVTVGVGWRHFAATNNNGIRLNVTIPLPIFNQNEGAIQEAGQLLLKTDSERRVARNSLILTLARAYETAIGARDEAELLGSSVVPKARQALEQINEGYAQGRLTLLEILDAQATFLQVTLRQQEALTNFHVALATLETLSGQPVRLTRGTDK